MATTSALKSPAAPEYRKFSGRVRTNEAALATARSIAGLRDFPHRVSLGGSAFGAPGLVQILSALAHVYGPHNAHPSTVEDPHEMRLDLSQNPRLDASCGSLLAGCLGANGLPLTSLDLSSCDLGTVGATVLFRALASNRTLRTLALTGNEIGVARPGWRLAAEKGYEVLPEGKAAGSATATATTTSSSSTAETTATAAPRANSACEALVEALAANTTLESLTLTRNRLSTEDIACIARGLCANRALRVLNLLYNSPLPEGKAALLACLRSHNLFLTHLLLDPLEALHLRDLGLPPHIRDETLAADKAWRQEVDRLLWRNQEVKRQAEVRLALAMGGHARLGQESPVRTALFADPLFDPGAFNLIFDFVLPPVAPISPELLRNAARALQQHHRGELALAAAVGPADLDRAASEESTESSSGGSGGGEKAEG